MKRRTHKKTRTAHIILNLVWSIFILILGIIAMYLHFTQWLPFSITNASSFAQFVNFIWAYGGWFIGGFLIAYAVLNNVIVKRIIDNYLSKI